MPVNARTFGELRREVLRLSGDLVATGTATRRDLSSVLTLRPLSVPTAQTLTAISLPLGDIQIFARHWVSMVAEGLDRTAHVQPTAYIDLMAHEFNMSWINTGIVATEMVRLNSVRDSADQGFISPAMSEKAAPSLSSSLKLSVAPVVFRSSPYPTRDGVPKGAVLGDLGPESVCLGSSLRWHTLNIQYQRTGVKGAGNVSC